ncbi:MAG TPA: DUF2752 domain-containing protein [Ktedonobacterales bacterium]
MRVAHMRAPARLALCLLVPLLVLLIPPRWLEEHPVPCLSRLLVGRRCPGCGMTRALSCALHGRWRAAWRHNPRVAVVLPLLVWEWSRLAARAWQELASAEYSARASSAASR